MSSDKDDISEVIGTDMHSTGLKKRNRADEIPPPSDEEKRDKPDKPVDVSSWANSGITFFGVAKTFATLPPNCYEPNMSQQGPYLEEIPLKTDNLLVLPDDASNEIISDFAEFWTLKPQFQARGFLHKRGILMWGPPGSGKTSTVQQIIQKVIHDLGGIVLMVQNPSVAVECLKMVRKIEPDRPIITVMEDLDSLISKYDESGFLSMLDGEAQVDNILSLATTNYPERLDPRFIDRPSRFDVVRKIDYPSDEAREFYLRHKEPSLTEEELAAWVGMSKGLTIPHLKEMIISVKCYNRDLDETVKRLKKMHTKKFKDGQGLGFASAEDKTASR